MFYRMLADAGISLDDDEAFRAMMASPEPPREIVNGEKFMCSSAFDSWRRALQPYFPDGDPLLLASHAAELFESNATPDDVARYLGAGVVLDDVYAFAANGVTYDVWQQFGGAEKNTSPTLIRLCRARKRNQIADLTDDDFLHYPSLFAAAIAKIFHPAIVTPQDLERSDAFIRKLIAAVPTPMSFVSQYVWGMWRTTQGIYRFDDDLAKALVDTEPSGMPVSVFQFLPEPVVYIPFSTALREHIATETFGATICLLGIDAQPLLVITLHTPTEPKILFAQSREDGTLRFEAGRENASWQVANAAVALAMYLATPDPDMAGDPRRPEITKTKAGPRVFAPPSQVLDVGLRIGAAFREHRESQADGENGGTRRSSAPTLRKAHWHRFWHGARNKPEERVLRPKWLPPIPVNLRPGDEIMATVRDVKNVNGKQEKKPG